MSQRLTFTLQAPLFWGNRTKRSRFSETSFFLGQQPSNPKSRKCKADCQINTLAQAYRCFLIPRNDYGICDASGDRAMENEQLRVPFLAVQTTINNDLLGLSS